MAVRLMGAMGGEVLKKHDCFSLGQVYVYVYTYFAKYIYTKYIVIH